jgi:glycosyltransferase involved in cell wall biosynthesis
MDKKGVVFNGKFLTATPTGVHRVAAELIRHIDAILSREPSLREERRWEVVHPPDATRSLALRSIASAPQGQFTWLPWEQFDLPRIARGKLLVNLCNLAPIFTRGSVTMMHDAQVFISPKSYSRLFGGWYRFALPRIGARAALILTVSEFSRQRLAEYGVAPLSRIAVVHNGADHMAAVPADPAIVARHGLTPGRYAVALANTQKHKNIGLLLRAFALPRMAGLRLVLFGRETAATFAAAGMTVPPNVVFVGSITDGEVRALMEEAACFLFPSTTEGFGLPPLEAMTVGCPAVIAPCGALPETCGDAAVRAAPDDAEGWADAILRFAEDDAARQEAACRGRAHAAHFTWGRAAGQLLPILRQIADG